MRKRSTDRSIQIGNAMTQHILDEDHRRSAGKNNNGAQLSARFADLPRGPVIIKGPRRDRPVRRYPGAREQRARTGDVRNNTNNRDTDARCCKGEEREREREASSP